MLATLLHIVLIGYLPGAILYRLPGRSRAFRAGLSVDERVFWTVILSVAWSLGAVLVLASIGRYRFETLLVINGAWAMVGLAAIKWLRYREPVARDYWTLIGPAGLVALGVWLYLPAAEYIVGGKDPGSYINEGIQIAQRGQLVVEDPVVASVPAEFRPLFFPSHNSSSYYGIRFVGYFVRDIETGAVVGQFPHLYPASIAIGYGLNGLSGARQTGPTWAILGLIAVYLMGARLFGRLPAAAAAGLLAINVASIWFARYPTTEVMMQTFTFAGILAMARALEGHRGYFGMVAGVLAAGMLFLRYDAVLVIAAFSAAATVAPAAGKRVGAAFWIGLTMTAGLALWYLLGPMRAYMDYPLAFMRNSGGLWLGAAALAGIVLTPRLLAHPRISPGARTIVPVGLAVLLTGLAIYAWFFRAEGGRLALGDAMAFRAFGWYITAPMLALAVAGQAWFLPRRFWNSPAFFVTLSVFSLFFFYKTRIVHEHFWAARRLVPVILPGALLLATGLAYALGSEHWGTAAAASSSDTRSRPPAWRTTLAILLLAAVTVPAALVFWRQSDPVRRHVEYAGLIPKVEALAKRFGDRDLVIVEGRDAGSDLHVLAMPLAYIYARNVLVLDSPIPPKRAFETFVAWAQTRYERVWFLGGGGTDLLTSRVTARPVASETFQVPEYASVYNAYPDGARRKEFDYGIYELLQTPPRPPGPVRLDIGANDDVNVVRFHAKERRQDTGMAYRWTRGVSYALLQGIAPDARELTIWLSTGGRPAQAPAAEVSVTLDGVALGTVTPVDPVRPYTLPIPPDLAAALGASADPARLELRTVTWSPAVAIGGPDTRELGVIVTRVEVR
jgi:hypothetical protein